MNHKSSRQLHGFSMIEVLVALVVLGVGMLGMASLFITSMRANGSAISRMQAVNLANDMADRIRANRSASTAYRTTGGAAAADNSCNDPAATASAPPVICSPTQMAAHDKLIWNNQISAQWPAAASAASGAITVVPGVVVAPTPPFATYTITITWTESDSSSPLSYSVTFQI